ncbi:MAG: AAA family ATPase [Candidatus Pacebacteria bacterium]|nr:AAA family ATPase [Candidatus Paceibacterota bacterium]
MSIKDKKPKIIFIYGYIAVGKLTVAKELRKLTGFKIMHNHLIIDFTNQLFGKEKNINKKKIREWLHISLIKEMVKNGENLICTHAYSDNYISSTGNKDTVFLKKIASLVKSSNGSFFPVHLMCEKKEMLKRVKNKSRSLYGKLLDSSILKSLLDKYDYSTPAKIKNNIQIDTTYIKPKKVAQMIVDKFNLK